MNKFGISLLLLALLIGIAIISNINPLPKTSATSNPNTDPQWFGLIFNSNTTSMQVSRIPQYTEGMAMNYTINTKDLTCVSNPGNGWAGAAEEIRLNSTFFPLLAAAVNYVCTTPTTWQIFWFWSNDTHVGESSITSLSTSTFPTLSGNMSMHYVSSSSYTGYEGYTYVSQTNTTYTYQFHIPGVYIIDLPYDFVGIQTQQQLCFFPFPIKCYTALTFSSGFSWNVTEPQFLVDTIAPPTWYKSNVVNSTGNFLDGYSLFSVVLNQSVTQNKLDVQRYCIKLCTDTSGHDAGLNVYYYGSNPPDVNDRPWSWLITKA